MYSRDSSVCSDLCNLIKKEMAYILNRQSSRVPLARDPNWKPIRFFDHISQGKDLIAFEPTLRQFLYRNGFNVNEFQMQALLRRVDREGERQLSFPDFLEQTGEEVTNGPLVCEKVLNHEN